MIRDKAWTSGGIEHYSGQWRSSVLQIFLEGLEQSRPYQVLDTGPICSENINFFGRRARRLYVCDMFLHLELARRKGLPADHALEALDYPEDHFEGILLWDLLDRLDERRADRLVRKCREMIKPRGLVWLLALQGGPESGQVSSFVVGENFNFSRRRQDHLVLPLFIRQNRDLLAMMSPFEPLKTFLHPNGLREFIFRPA